MLWVLTNTLGVMFRRLSGVMHMMWHMVLGIIIWSTLKSMSLENIIDRLGLQGPGGRRMGPPPWALWARGPMWASWAQLAMGHGPVHGAHWPTGPTAAAPPRGPVPNPRPQSPTVPRPPRRSGSLKSKLSMRGMGGYIRVYIYIYIYYIWVVVFLFWPCLFVFLSTGLPTRSKSFFFNFRGGGVLLTRDGY